MINNLIKKKLKKKIIINLNNLSWILISENLNFIKKIINLSVNLLVL